MNVDIKEIKTEITNYASQTVFDFINEFCKSDGTIKTIDDNFKAIKTAFTNLNLTSIDSDITPSEDDTYSLGTSSKRFKKLHIAGDIKIRDSLIIDEEPATEEGNGGMRIETADPLHIRGEQIIFNDKTMKYVISNYTIEDDEINLILEEV